MQTILIYSGGLDSTTLLYHLRAEGQTVAALSVDYGQRHRQEVVAAQALCAALGVEHQVVDLRAVRPLLAGSSQTDPTVAVPQGHYADLTMKQTVVPNRNMLLLALAGAWAVSRQAEAIAYAAHGGDHAIYPDCRPAFVAAFAQTLALANWHPVTVLAPFLALDKAAIVRLGASLGVPFGQTWSCYDPQTDLSTGRTLHCGRCGTCCERALSFDEAGIEDPTIYMDTTYWKRVSLPKT
jgi:7-cyano-7-deazaguanine synthase